MDYLCRGMTAFPFYLPWPSTDINYHVRESQVPIIMKSLASFSD